MTEEVRALGDLARRVLTEVSTLTLATSDREGRPWASPVYFVLGDGLDLWFLSDVRTRHGRNLLERPWAAAAAYPATWAWEAIRGVQLEGPVDRIPSEDPAWEAMWARFQARFPDVAPLLPLARRHPFWRLRPRWIRILDNRRGWGWKVEGPLPEGAEGS